MEWIPEEEELPEEGVPASPKACPIQKKRARDAVGSEQILNDEDMGESDRQLQSLQAYIGNYLTENANAYPMLFQLWKLSYVEDGVLVLPESVANTLSENHPNGYRRGVWHLVSEYETLLSQALLTNSNRKAPGYGQPKSFSAWPREHNRKLYQKASDFRKKLPKRVVGIPFDDRASYKDLIRQWLNSIIWIRKISGNTRLDLDQLQQLKVALLEEEVEALPPRSR